MTAATGSQSPTRLRRAAPWLAIVAGLLLIAVVAGGSDEASEEVFDPQSTRPGGTRALVLLLEESGAEVEVTTEIPGEDTDVWLVLVDGLTERHREEALDWVEAGGVLVVADPYSSLAASATGDSGAAFGDPILDRGVCDIEALAGLSRLSSDLPFLFEVEPGVPSCFGDGSNAFVVSTPRGSGWVVSLGSPWSFVNEQLDEEDNAALATTLLAPAPGTTVAVLPPVVLSSEGEVVEERSLTDVMSPGARFAIVQLVVAFVAYAWFRARRLGKPVVEPQPVDIAGSELVLAVGNLLQQQRSPARAADLLRRDLCRRLTERLGLPHDARPEVIADIASQRTGVPRDRVLAAVGDIPVTSDDQLIELARTIDEIRKEILHGS